MWNFIKKVAASYLFKGIEKKFVKFLKEVFAGKTGGFLDKYHNEINQAVDIVDDIYKLVTTGDTEGTAKFRDIKLEYDIDLSEKDVEILISKDRKADTLRREMAYNLVKKDLQNKGKEVVDHAIDTGISLAVARKKK